jgi:septum formation protein
VGRSSSPFKTYLASTSSFRRKILEDAGIRHEVCAPLCDEKSVLLENPRDLALGRALLKGRDVARRVEPDSLVISADQVLGMNNKAYDKAESENEAYERLKDFAGNTHVLFSAVCVFKSTGSRNPDLLFQEVVEVPMTMRRLTEEELKAYISTGEWQGCVGCYRIEGQGRRLFSSIGGSDDAVIGLPLAGLVAALAAYGS